MTRLCPGCGGDGFIDEAQAHRHGLPPIEGGRTDICPFCMGVGVDPHATSMWRLAFEAAVVGAAALIFGIVVGAAIVLAQRFA